MKGEQNLTAANGTSASVALANNTSENSSTTIAPNVTTINSTSSNFTSGNMSSVKTENVTSVNSQGNVTLNSTGHICFKKRIIRSKAFVKSFTLQYSDNGELWKTYHEGGNVKVCALITCRVLGTHLITLQLCEKLLV